MAAICLAIAIAIFPFAKETWDRWEVICTTTYVNGEKLPGWFYDVDYQALFSAHAGESPDPAVVNSACENYRAFRAWHDG